MSDWLTRSIEALDREKKNAVLRSAYSDPAQQTRVVIDDLYGAKRDVISSFLLEHPQVSEVHISSCYAGVHSAERINYWLHASDKITSLSIASPIPWNVFCQVDLSAVTKLYVRVSGDVGQEKLRAPRLESLSLSVERLEELSPLEELLIEKRPYDFSGLPNLSSVDFHYWETLHFSSLKCLRKLKILRVYYCGLSDLSWLSSDYQLDRLYVSSGINDLSGIETQRSLTHLDLSHSNLTDISLLQSCTKLENLDLRHNNIKDLSPLNAMKSLVFVNATRNPILCEGALRSKSLETLLVTEKDEDDHMLLAKVYGLVHKAAQSICREDNVDLDKVPGFIRQRTMDNRKKSISERFEGWIQSAFHDTLAEISPFDYHFHQYSLDFIKKYVFLSKREYPFLTIGISTNERINRLSSAGISSRKPVPGRLVYTKENLVDIHAQVKGGTGKLWIHVSNGYYYDKGRITKAVQKQIKLMMPQVPFDRLDIEVELIGYFDKAISDDIAGATAIAIHSAIYRRAIKPKLAFSLKTNDKGVIVRTEPSSRDISAALLYGFSSVVCYCTNKTLRTEGNTRISYATIEELLKDIYLDEQTYRRLNEMSDFENELYEVLMSHREAVVDRVRLRGLLQDCFPKNKQIINLMLLLVNMNYLDEMEHARVYDDLMVQRYANRLEQEFGVNSEAALQASHAWGVCYGKYILNAK